VTGVEPSDPAAHFAEHGWVLTETLDEAGVEALRGWVEEVAAWPDDGGDWLHHRELTDEGPKLCRSENVIELASALLGEPAVLYKEKINYKLVGGAGYAPHQDAPAYRFVESHVSCMVAVDDATEANGCLEVVSGMHHEILPMDEVGCIRADVVDALTWVPAPVRAGQTLWFHSRTPHRSGPNTSPQDRRALYPTYNALREGDLREDYYRQKLAEFAEARAAGATEGRVQVSLIGDFQGRPVE
jgi:hypothetical protein